MAKINVKCCICGEMKGMEVCLDCLFPKRGFVVSNTKKNGYYWMQFAGFTKEKEDGTQELSESRSGCH